MSTEMRLTQAKISTRYMFLVAGIVAASLASLMPFLKHNAGVENLGLGLLIVFLGVGALVSMPFAGGMSAAKGPKVVIICSGSLAIAMVPLLLFAATPWLLALGLFLFGAGLGALDVSMNIHGAQVEQKANKRMMSGFHCLFSVGAIAGSGGAAALLLLNVAPWAVAIGIFAVAAILFSFQLRGLLDSPSKKPAAWCLPKKHVWFLAILAGISFLVEGAILDWGSLLLMERNVATTESGGLGYMCFSVAMVLGRLWGDKLVAMFGDFWLFTLGAVAAGLGLAVFASAESLFIAMFGVFVSGLGSANIVPILFSTAASQKVMPSELAVASVSSIAYAGVLLGPALIGLLAHQWSLSVAFTVLAVSMVLFVALSKRIGLGDAP